jgi:hypothetical protein
VGRQHLVHMVAEQQARPAATLHELYPQELPSDVDSLHVRAYDVRSKLAITPDGSTGLGNLGSIRVDRPGPASPV